MAPKARKSDAGKNSQRNVKKKSQSDHSKVGLIFPVARLGRHLKGGRYAERVGKSGAVFMAAVLEYMVCEILELAGQAATEAGKNRIAPRHLQLAVRNDEELAKLMASTMISNGGYMSNIHPFLLRGKKGKKDSETQEM